MPDSLGASGKESTCQYRGCKRHGFSPWVRKIPGSRKWKPAPVFLPRKSHGQRSLAGYGPWDCEELDMIEHTHTNTHTEYCFLTYGPFSDFTKHSINIFYSKSKKKRKCFLLQDPASHIPLSFPVSFNSLIWNSPLVFLCLLWHWYFWRIMPVIL